MTVAARRTYSLRTYLIGNDVIASGGIREIADIKKLADAINAAN